MLKKIYNFALEERKWYKAGRPYRTEEKIKALYNICSQCEHFKSTENKNCESCGGQCKVCGCRLSPIKEVFNKLAWATTKCPLEEPKWTEEPEHTELNTKLEEVEEAKTNPPPAPPNIQGGCGCR